MLKAIVIFGCLVMVSLVLLPTFSTGPFRFRLRDVTLPGASHFSLWGLTWLYPGHSTPDVEHLLHAGSVKSQTKQRRRHSQQ